MQHGRAEDLDVQRVADSGLSPVRQVYSPGPRRADMQTRPDRTRRAEHMDEAGASFQLDRAHRADLQYPNGVLHT